MCGDNYTACSDLRPLSLNSSHSHSHLVSTSKTMPPTLSATLVSDRPLLQQLLQPLLQPLEKPSNHSDTVLKFHIPAKPTAVVSRHTVLSSISSTPVNDNEDMWTDITTVLYNDNDNDNKTHQTSLIKLTTIAATSPRPTRRKIYIRGHLLQTKKRHFHPADPEESDDNDDESLAGRAVPQKHVGGLPKIDPVECPPAAPSCEESYDGAPNKRKKKHSTGSKKKFHNYKMIHDTLPNAKAHQSTEFYAWIFGAAMLGIGAITTLASCVVYCLYSDKWKQRRARRRKWDKNGEYERVDSVSSIVDNSSMAPPDLDNDQIDAVSII